MKSDTEFDRVIKLVYKNLNFHDVGVKDDENARTHIFLCEYFLNIKLKY